MHAALCSSLMHRSEKARLSRAVRGPFIRRGRGVTLIEIVIAISIAAILMAVGLPMMRYSQDSSAVKGASKRLETFLNDARTTARTQNAVVALRAVGGGGTFADCAQLRSEVAATRAEVRTFAPEGGLQIKNGPALQAIAILPSGDYDVTQNGYLMIQGTYPDHAAYVEFNPTGSIAWRDKQPASQVTSSSVGSQTRALLPASDPSPTPTPAPPTP